MGLVVLGVFVVSLISALIPEPAGRAEARAERAEEERRWVDAAGEWAAVDRAGRGTGRTKLAEARAWLQAGQAAKAEAALRRGLEIDPAEADTWVLLLELLRVEDRAEEAFLTGRDALSSVGPTDRRRVLRAWTLAALADVPDDQARATLGRWVEQDPNDVDARVALLEREASPRAGRTEAVDAAGPKGLMRRIDVLTGLVAAHPAHGRARAALAIALAEAGRIEEGREVLRAWPSRDTTATRRRVEGRYALEYDGKPDQAREALQAVLAVVPNDWRTRYRLTRALQASGRADEARVQARLVDRHRELLDPVRLGQRLNSALGKLDDPASRVDLAELCRGVGLEELANAWLIEGAR